MVNKSAGEVVGASQAGKENIEVLETIDFTKMLTHTISKVWVYFLSWSEICSQILNLLGRGERVHDRM